MKTRLKIGLGLLLAALFGSMQAQSDSIAQYLEIAARNNPTVLEKYYDYQAALRRLPQVHTLPDPEISVGFFLSPMQLLGGEQYAKVQFMQMFPWFGSLRAAKDEMSMIANTKYAAMDGAKFDVFLQVQMLWYEIYKLNQNIRISNKNLEILASLERLSLARFKGADGSSSSEMQGMNAKNGSSLSDVFRVNIEQLDLKNDISSLESKKRSMIARFNSLLNRDSEIPVSVPDSLMQVLYTVPVLTDSLWARNPQLNMKHYREQAANAHKRKIKRMSYPKVGLGVEYAFIGKSAMSTSSMNGQDMIMPKVSLTLPIYGSRYYNMKREASYQYQAAQESNTATLNMVKAEYYEVLEAIEDAQRRINLYSKQTQLAQQSLNLTIRAFSAASSSLTDVLTLDRQLLNYELKQANAMADYHIAISRMNALFPYK